MTVLQVVGTVMGRERTAPLTRHFRAMATTAFMIEILYKDSNGHGWKRLSKPEDLATNLDELAKEGAWLQSVNGFDVSRFHI